jgi:tetratricopeptide (TPR) repeat protein
MFGGEYLKLDQPDKAAEHLRQAVTKDPKYSAAWKLLGKALADSGRKEEAIKAYEDGIKVAEEKGDKQAAKEMTVFLKRLQK